MTELTKLLIHVLAENVFLNMLIVSMFIEVAESYCDICTINETYKTQI